MAIDFERLGEAPQLLDYLLQMEDVLDSLDCYVYRGWINGEVVEGPLIRRHWATVGLFYPQNKLPDPKAIRRMLKYGLRVNLSKMSREGDEDGEEEGDAGWLVRLSFPRRLLGQMGQAEIDFYEDDVDVDDVEDAKDAGLNDESGYQTDQQKDPLAQGGPDDDPKF